MGPRTMRVVIRLKNSDVIFGSTKLTRRTLFRVRTANTKCKSYPELKRLFFSSQKPFKTESVVVVVVVVVVVDVVVGG